MSRRSTKSLVLNRQLALQAQPALERINEDFQQSLAHLETLHKTFRRKFLKLFEESANNVQTSDGDKVMPALLNIYVFTQANLAGSALSHLGYVADQINLANGLLELAAGSVKPGAKPL